MTFIRSTNENDAILMVETLWNFFQNYIYSIEPVFSLPNRYWWNFLENAHIYTSQMEFIFINWHLT